MEVIVEKSILLVLCALASLCFGVMSAIFASRAGTGFAKNLRHDMFYRVQKFSFSNIDKFSSSSIVTRLTSDVAQLQMAFQMIIRMTIRCTMMLVLAVTIHNLPEGMAVGVVFAGADSGVTNISLASAFAVALGIAIQNIPEGAIISMPMRAAGNSRWKSFFIGSLSGAVEPIGALAVLLLASLLMPVLPYMLTFAAGAMFYVVVEELIPEASSGQHSNLSTIGFAIGFVLMMVLDVVLG
jgi:zinc transporter ZupT